MRRAKKLIGFVLTLAIFLISMEVSALAELMLNFPSALRSIESEAFMGDMSIGKVVLPAKIKSIGQRAFADSSLSEINFPESISYIADDAFSGCTNVVATYTSGTYAANYVMDHPQVFVNAAVNSFEIAPDVITITVGEEYSLYTSPSDIDVTWTSSNTRVATVTAEGFVRGISNGRAEITATTTAGNVAVCQVNVNQKITATVSLQATQDGAGNVTLSWQSHGDNIFYQIYEQKKGSLNFIRMVQDQTSITFGVATEGEHTYVIRPGKLNDDGKLEYGDLSQMVTINVQHLWSFDVRIQGIHQTGPNSIQIVWQGVSPADSYEIAEKRGSTFVTCVNEIAADQSNITLEDVTEGLHSYTVRANYTDTNGVLWHSAWAQVQMVNVLAQQECVPAIPTLVFEDESMAFSLNEDTAPVYQNGNVSVTWAPSDHADTYSVILEKKTASGYSILAEEHDIQSHSYMFNSSLFDDVTGREVYRFGISAQGIGSSDTAYFFFVIEPVDNRILINGKETACWERANRLEGSREFAITSNKPWTAVSDVSWITTIQRDGTLELFIKRNPTQSQSSSRQGHVTISNGEGTAVINVIQGALREGECNTPSIFEQPLSTDSNNPTLIPAGGFKLSVELDTPYALLRFLEKDSSGNFSRKSYWILSSEKDQEVAYEWGGITFSAGKDFCIEVSGRYSNDINVYPEYGTDEDANTTRYYFRTTETNHYLYVDGKEALTVDYIETKSVNVVASNLFTVTSDANWLSYGLGRNSDSRKTLLDIEADDNYTGSTRIGHLTLSTGIDTAVIEVVQMDMTPRIIAPANISTTESSPTQITSDLFIFDFYGQTVKLAYKNGSSWIEESNAYYSVNSEALVTNCWFDDTVAANKVYRVTVSSENSPVSSVYYIKRTTSTSDYTLFKVDNIATISEAIHSIEIPSTAFSNGITLNASSSWKVSSNASWLTLSTSSGTSGTKKALTISATENIGSTDRTGIITFKVGAVVTGKLTVKQLAASNEHLEVLIDNVPIDFDNTTAHVSGYTKRISSVKPVIASGAYANVSSNVNWITVTSSVASGKSVNIALTENTTGSVRTGKVTFTYGTVSKILTITQEPALDAVALTAPVLSTTENAPTALAYSESPLTIKWSRIANAKKYRIDFNPMDNDSRYYEAVVDTGASNYAYSIPADWFDAAYSGLYELKISCYDAYGNSGNATYYYFTRAARDTVFLNGKTSQDMTDVSDVGAIDEYQIATSGSWTATASASWINVSSKSGTGNQTVTVTIDRNNGSKRSGTLTFKCGSSAAVLNIDQCAVLSEYPSLKTPSLSNDITQPSLVSKSNSMTVTWDLEPQAHSYEVNLGHVVNAGTTHILQKSYLLRKGQTSFTFDTSELIPGQTYVISFRRSADYEIGRSHTTGASYYFALMPDNAFLMLKNVDVSTVTDDTLIFYADGEEDSEYYRVKSSGTWTAVSSDSTWLMVAKTVKHVEILEEDGKEPSDYDMTVGNSGDGFYICALANDTHNTRRGYVTVSTAGVNYQLEVIQDQYYVEPQLMNPALNTHPSEATELPLAAIDLTWTRGEGNTGVYDIVLSEQDGRSFYEVYRQRNLSGNTATIPVSKLNENKTYRIRIESTLENSGEDIYTSYYFTTAFVDALTVSVDADWSQVNYGGCVDFTVNAAGGAGGYKYAFELLCDGKQENITSYDTLKYYQFQPLGQGTYTLKVYVKDSAGKTATCTSSFLKNDTNIVSVAVPNTYAVALNAYRHSLNYVVISSGSWVLESVPDWISVSANAGVSGDELVLVVTRNDGILRIGKVTLRSSNGATSELTITQNGNKDIAMVLDGSIHDENAQTVSISFSTTDRWTADGNATWVTLGSKAGSAGNNILSVSIAANTGAEREAKIAITCNGAQVEYSIKQTGKSINNTSLSLSETVWQVDSPNAAIKNVKITAEGNWFISEIPDWMTTDTVVGVGNHELNLRCDSNAEQDARTGSVIVTDGNVSQEIKISQPGNGVNASIVSVKLSTTTIKTGVPVSFEVKTKYADQVQLIVDGKAHEVYDVINDLATFTRAFSSDGVRQVCIMPIRFGNNGIASSPVGLTVTSEGTLAKPIVNAIGDVLIGSNVNVSWSKIPNATEYTLYFSDGYTYFRYDSTTELSTSIEGKYISDVGNYSVEVLATAPGYAQSSASVEFKAIKPSVNFSVLTPKENNEFETHDSMRFTANNPSGYWLRYKITDGTETWYVPSESCVNTTDAEVYWNAPETAGTYSVVAVAYVDQYAAKENGWGQTSKAIHFNVKSGTITWLSIAGVNYGFIQQGENVVEKGKMRELALRTNLGVEKMDVKLDGAVIKTLTQAEGNTNSSPYYRDYSYVIPVSIALDEGSHTYQFIAVDKDGKEYSTKLYKMYAYSTISPALTKYPADKAAKFKVRPDDNSGTVLKPSDKLIVTGSCGSDYYCKKADGTVGFVAKNEVGDDPIIDWSTVDLSVLSWANENEEAVLYMLPKDYVVSFNWSINTELPSYYGYNVYLVPSYANRGHTTKINDTPVIGTKLSVSSSKCKAFYSAGEENYGDIYAQLRVEIVDMRNGSIMKSAVSKGECNILPLTSSIVVLEDYQRWIYRAVAYHDIIYRGSAIVDGREYSCRTIKDVTGIGKVYSTATGDFGDIPMTYVTQGALMAESIMDSLSSAKSMKTVDVSGFKEILSWVGFDVGIIDAVETDEENMYRDLLYLYRVLDKDDNHGAEIEEWYKKWEKAAKQHAETQDFKNVLGQVKGGISAANVMTALVKDYFMYRSVKRSDVLAYINLFEGSTDASLVMAAKYLEVMTGGDKALFGYLLYAYGFNAGKNWAFDKAYDAVMDAIPWQFKYTIKGASLVNNFAFNTKGTLEKAYELEVLSQQCEMARQDFEKFFPTFKSDPSKYYKEMQNRQNVYLSLLEIELNKFNAFASSTEEGMVAKLINAVSGKTVAQMDVAFIIRLCGDNLDEHLNVVYAAWIAPYLN